MRQLVSRLRILIRNDQKKFFYLLVVMMVIFSLLEMVSIGLIVPIFSTILDINANSKFTFFENLFFDFSNYDQTTILKYLFSIFVLLFVFKFLYSALFFYFRNKLTFTIRNDLSKRIFLVYLKRPFSFHLKNNSSKIAINCKYEIDIFTSNILQPVLDLMSDAVIFSGLIVLLLIFDPFVTLITFLIFSIVIYLYQMLLKKRSLTWAKERQYFDGLINKSIREGLGSIKEVILNSRESFFVKKLVYYLNRNLIVSVRSQMSTDMPRHLLELVAIVSFLIIFYVLKLSGYQMVDIVIMLAIFAAVSFKVLPAFNRVMSNIQRIRYATPIVNLLYEEISKDNNIDDTSTKSLKSKLILKKKIEIKNLSFSYSENKKVFNNINFDLEVGNLIGLSGESGSGKSTLLNLISGLDNSYEGNIIFDGIDLKNKKITWVDQVAYISQKPYFLDDKIKNNIAFAEDENDINEKKIHKCIEMAQLTNFIQKLENGIDTIIGEDGTRLSGGQLQRLAIARALYNEFRILILDESLNSIDINNENKIMKILNSLKDNRIIFLTSHKPSLIQECDKKFKIENQKIISF